jgi:hypothetical protein
MKKYILLFVLVLNLSVVNAQGVTDAVRYAQENLSGTARFSAMSGAFGALGGDLSSMNINPAGSAVFSNNKIGGTFTSFNKKNSSDYFGTVNKQSDSNFDISQLGGVFVFEDASGTKNWRKLSFGINYENTNSFDNSQFSKGTNPTNSVSNYFLSYANANANQNVIPLDLVENGFYDDLNFADQQAFLGYQGYVINPNNITNTTFYVANNPGGNYKQENVIISNGYNGKLTFNSAASYKDKLLIGANFNTHFTDYRQSSRFTESNSNSATSGLRNLTFSNDLYAYGSGLSFNVGAIVKLDKGIRAGLAWESPTWYTLNDELKQDLRTTGFNYGSPSIPGLSDVNPDSDVTIIYPIYKLQTPSKTTASLAYVFGKKGLISVDYAVKDYSNTNYKGKDARTLAVNKTMSTVLNSSSEIRVGAEYRINQVSLRAGLRNEQSPYKDKKIMSDLQGYSAGIGYNFGDTILDLSFSQSKRTSQQGFFQQGFTDGAKIQTLNNNVGLSLIFEL